MIDRPDADITAELATMKTTLGEIKTLVTLTNGRVTDLETWRDGHEATAVQTRSQLAELTDSVSAMRGEVSATLEACVVSPATIRTAVAQVLDERSVMDDANRWRAIVGGARAIGCRVVLTMATVSAGGMLGFLIALGRVV